jgi:NAD(P)-dependent dehydrogenase (short-subunit alcohol dehydrogenase family)
VVNTASATGIGLLGAGIATYAASKHAIVGLTEWLRHELDHVAPEVGTTIFCPGPVSTRLRDAGRNRPEQYPTSARHTTPIDPSFDHDLPSTRRSPSCWPASRPERFTCRSDPASPT